MVRVCPAFPIARRRRHAHHRVAALLAALLLFCPARTAAAQGLDLTLVPPTLTGAPGLAVTFDGRITNTTGAPVSAIDLFLNFSGYDPTIFTDITQILGTTNFTLPNNTFSAIVPLFRVMIAADAPAGDYGFTVTLQDINDVVSPPVAADVMVQAAISTVPEPSTVVLLASGLLLVAAVRRRSSDARSI